MTGFESSERALITLTLTLVSSADMMVMIGENNVGYVLYLSKPMRLEAEIGAFF